MGFDTYKSEALYVLGSATEKRCEGSQRFEPFHAVIVRLIVDAGDVAARPSKAGRERFVGDRADGNDGDLRRRLMSGDRRRSTSTRTVRNSPINVGIRSSFPSASRSSNTRSQRKTYR